MNRAPDAGDVERRPRWRRAAARIEAAARRFDGDPRAVAIARRLRRLLPGDPEFGDPLSTAGSRQPHVVGRRLAALTAERPGALREAGLSALQVWQALSEAQGRGGGDRERAIAFTDLVGFSDWALEAGDDAALALLRRASLAIEPPVRSRGGEVVKWLGDGMMAVFDDPQQALEALFEACRRVAEIEVDGYSPRIRAGLHVGRPRRLGGDYLGVDVNVAARVAEEASADEVLLSDRALALLDTEALRVRRKRFFRVKGVPRDVTAHVVAPR